MNYRSVALLLLGIMIYKPGFGQEAKRLIRVPLYTTLDTIAHNRGRFYLQKTPPVLKGIPPDLDTFLLFSYSFSNNQMIYDNYKQGLIPEDRFNAIGIDPKTITDHPIRHKLNVISGLKGKKKIIIADTNNNGTLADESVFELPAEVSEEDTFAEDNWLTLMLVHVEQFHNNRIGAKQILGKIDPYVKLVNPPSELEEKLMLSFKEFEYKKGLFSINGEEYLITTDRISKQFELIPLNKTENAVFPTIKIGQSIHVGRSLIYFEDFDQEKNELLLIKIHNDEIKTSEYGGLVGMKAPNIAGENLAGKFFRLNDYQGDFTMLQFWGTWCGPCKGDHPALKSWFDKFKKANIRLIGIAMDQDETLVKDYVEKTSLDWEQVFFRINGDKFKRITNDYYVTAYPTYFLIDPNGVIIARGSLQSMEKDFQKILDR